MWLETVISPALARPDGKELLPFQPFPLGESVVFGPRGSGAQLAWEETHTVSATPTPRGVRFKDHRTTLTPSGLHLGGAAQVVRPGQCFWRAPLLVRVLAAPDESAGWPRALPRPPGPWDEAMHSVQADRLLELGLRVGHRFLQRDEAEDATWLPAAPGLGSTTTATWRKGTLDTLALTAPAGESFGRGLAAQAVSATLRALVLRCEPPLQPAEVVAGLIHSGGLPCLEVLRCEVVEQPRPPTQESLRDLPGFAAAFPALTGLEVAPVLSALLGLLRR